MVQAQQKRLRGSLRLPGDKSISHRALLFNALSQGEATIEGLSHGGDVQGTMRCIQALGCTVRTLDDQRIHLVSDGNWHARTAPLDCGNSGTTARLLCGALAGAGITVTLCGDESLSKRPMKRVMHPLAQMGARFQHQEGRLPVTIEGQKTPLKGINYTMPMASAQVKSAILLAGLWADPTAQVQITEPLPTRDHTERMLNAMGCEIQKTASLITLVGRKSDLQSTDILVPADMSSSAFLMVAASLLPGSRLILEQINLNPTRTPMLDVLRQLGVSLTTEVTHESAGEAMGNITLESPDRLVGNLTLTAEDVPLLIDEIPILSILGMYLDGHVSIRGAEELRVKESDRLASILGILKACQVDVESFEDGFSFQGNPSKKLPDAIESHRFATHHDHRLVMALEILSLCSGRSLDIEGREWVNISYPTFYEHLQKVLEN